MTPNARFIEDLGVDSLDTIELAMKHEEALGIWAPDEEAEKLQTLQDIVAYIEGVVNGHATKSHVQHSKLESKST